MKYWVKPDIENRIKEGSIKAYTNSTLMAIREKEVDIQTPDGLITIGNDYVIAMTGLSAALRFSATGRRSFIAQDGVLLPTTIPAPWKPIYLISIAGRGCMRRNEYACVVY